MNDAQNPDQAGGNGADDQGGNSNASGTTPDAGNFAPITSQQDLDRIISDRLARERAKYADYRDLKQRAARLDEIEESQKTEAQKTADKLAKLEQRAADAEAGLLRWRIANEESIPAEDAEAFMTGRDEETLRKQAQRLAELRNSNQRQNGWRSGEGRGQQQHGDPDRAFAAQLFNSST